MSVEQLNAIDVLVLGRTDQETATAVGVARETVNRWRNENPYFAAELNKHRLQALTAKAVDAIETALDGGDSKVAVEVLKIVGIYGEMEPPSGPVDVELVMLESARQWAVVAPVNSCSPVANWRQVTGWSPTLCHTPVGESSTTVDIPKRSIIPTCD